MAQSPYMSNIDEEARAQHIHSKEEIMAQSICTAITGFGGWVYAVERRCAGKETCTQICGSKALHVQDAQTVNRLWQATAALHVYKNRPSTSPSTVAVPHLGLKVYRYPNINSVHCGPNFCCCFVH